MNIIPTDKIVELQIEQTKALYTFSKMYEQLLTLKTSIHYLTNTKKTIEQFGRTVTIEDLIGKELTVLSNFEGEDDPVEKHIDTSVVMVKGKILTISKMIIDSSKHFILTTVDDLYDIIKQIENKLDKISEYANPEFTTGTIEINKPYVDIDVIAKQLPDVNKQLKLVFTMLNTNMWVNSDRLFNMVNMDYINSFKSYLERTSHLVYTNTDIEDIQETLRRDLKGIKYILDGVRNTAIVMRLPFITEFNIAEGEKDPIEIIRFYNLILFNMMKYSFTHIQTQVNIVNNINNVI